MRSIQPKTGQDHRDLLRYFITDGFVYTAKEMKKHIFLYRSSVNNFISSKPVSSFLHAQTFCVGVFFFTAHKYAYSKYCIGTRIVVYTCSFNTDIKSKLI